MVLISLKELGNGLPAEPSEGDSMLLRESRKFVVLLLGEANGYSGLSGHVAMPIAAYCSKVHTMKHTSISVKLARCGVRVPESPSTGLGS